MAAVFLVVALVGPYRLHWPARPHAARQPSDAASTTGEPLYVAQRLAECLTDALRVADSRGLRLPRHGA
ncbi:hypothetical protein ADK82_11260 [Streptomyces sp. NRRL S-4]|nr:hypothetical protein ADK82_11260 [Streptomyces sp. NRRL S-4]